jgi:hypothetical protein
MEVGIIFSTATISWKLPPHRHDFLEVDAYRHGSCRPTAAKAGSCRRNATAAKSQL